MNSTKDLMNRFPTEKIKDGTSAAKIENKVAVDDVVYGSDSERAGEIIIEAGHVISKDTAELICTSGVDSVEIMNAPRTPLVTNSLAEDNTNSHEEAMLRI